MIGRIVVIGATGDLSRRHLLPGLAHVVEAMPTLAPMELIGVGRGELSSHAFRALVAESLDAHASTVRPQARREIVTGASYRQSDLRDPASMRAALAGRPGIVYLALPPWAFEPALRCLHAAGIDRGSRVVVEKPFAESEASAHALNDLIGTLVPEQNVFRVDHFLHHEATHNIIAMRFGTGEFEDFWRREAVERVEITWDETAALATRSEYYDRVGALRDMIQSHLLTLLATVAMERPEETGHDSLRRQRVAAIRAVTSLAPPQVRTGTIRGRYTAGRSRGLPVGDYIGEPGVDPARDTETFAAVRLSVALPRWSGVPFLLRTGKALARDDRWVELRFRAAGPRSLTGRPAAIRFQMAPDRTLVDHGDGRGFRDVGDTVASEPDGLPASARLLRAVIRGEQTWFLRPEEPEECWRIVEPILQAWASGAAPMRDYRAGSEGPPGATP